jgi:cytochrome c peroxidase
MTDAQIADLICFLKTLTDGYQPSAQPASGPCVD